MGEREGYEPPYLENPQDIADYQKTPKGEDLKESREDLMNSKKESLAEAKAIIQELTEKEKLPKELVLEMVDIRRDIADKVESDEYVSELDEALEDKIKRLTLKITRKTNDNEIREFQTDAEGEIHIIFKDGHDEIIKKDERDLLEALRQYYDTYRMANNGTRFRRNVKDVENWMEEENKLRKLNFYTEEEKEAVFIEEMEKKYKDAGFSEDELKELIGICNLKKLSELEIQDIKVLSKIKDIFSRYLNGDTAQYVGLSAALMIPAFIEGYAPMSLANAFKENQTDLTQVGLFSLLTMAAAGASSVLNKKFKDFLNKNFKKRGGMSEEISQNVVELPADEVGKFGMAAVKERIAKAKESYEDILKLISFDIVPAATTLLTSAVMLARKSPALALGTAAATGITIFLDRYVDKKYKFWEKEGKAERKSEDFSKKLEEQLNAHMEIILSGEKDVFEERLELLLTQERLANSDKRFLRTIRQTFGDFTRSLNLIFAGVTSYFAGGTSDKFVAALMYSGNFNMGITSLLNAKRNLLGSFREMQQMDLMFNGFAEEEKQKEKNRVGISEIEGGGIHLKDVSVAMGKRKILDDINLDVPEGSMAYLQGLSGAGKSTLMKVMSGYYRPTSGEVSFGDVDMAKIKKSGDDSIYSKIAYLPQFPYMLEGSIKANVLFGNKPDIDDDEINAVLKDVGLNNRFDNLKEKLKGGRGDTSGASGGESSRIAVARILLKIRNSDARIVFLDEPTASVDKETKFDIAKIINKEKNKRPDVTFIVISHDEEFVKELDCSINVEMEKGKIIRQTDVKKP